MAEGEPMVWLAGGALAFCLAMIASLLALILVQGLQTFWPARIVRFQLADGRAVMGEIAVTESYPMQGNEPQGNDPQGDESNKPQRRLVRTGNFELTNSHFQWITDTEQQQAPTRPEWAATVERVEWGRFYGEPDEYVQVVPRHLHEDETALTRFVQFWSMHAAQLPGDQQSMLAERLPQIQQQLREMQTVATLAQKRELQAHTSPGESIWIVLPSGESIAADSKDAETLVADRFERRWSGNQVAWQQFLTRHAAVRAARQRLYQLEKHDVGRINHEMERSRLAVRRSELDAGVSVSQLCATRLGIEQGLRALDQSWKAMQQQAAVPTSLRADDVWQNLSSAVLANLQSELDRQREQLEQDLEGNTAKIEKLPASVRDAVKEDSQQNAQASGQLELLQQEIDDLRAQSIAEMLAMRTADGQRPLIRVGEIVRAYLANQLTTFQRLTIYLGRWAEFIGGEPREANSEGGVFPAIWGTVAMTLIMCVIVVPFGVLAALYLREYARAGFMVSAVRIAINNLAGVPSIVFGVFGLGFFCYFVGAFVDGGPPNVGIASLDRSTWWTYLSVLLVVSGVGSGLLVYQLTRSRYHKSGWGTWLQVASVAIWCLAVYLALVVVLRNPHFGGLFAAELPNPTYGKGGILWASLTLSLLTLPVVIVATEEALAAVPNSLREGSYASGASQWQTIRRIVLPHAMPGIMTGMILAMARGAGEVAPLMLVGAVKMAPELPLDSIFPFLHGERSFMHLGFHIYDLGFQSQNSDAARPVVFTTTLLLIGIVVSLNVLAIILRARLRKRFQGGQF